MIVRVHVARLLCAALLAPATVGCVSSRYPVVDLPYLKRVQRSGEVLWRVGEREYPFNPFGDGLLQATSDVPEAHAVAEEAQSDAIAGLVLSAVGPMVMASGPIAALMTQDSTGNLSTGDAVLITTTFVGGMVMTLTGLSYALSSRSRELDAVNLYNDRIWEQHGLLPPAVPTPSRTLPPADPVGATP